MIVVPLGVNWTSGIKSGPKDKTEPSKSNEVHAQRTANVHHFH